MSVFAVGLIALLSWGALAIGGWPSWAAAPTLVLALTTGILGFLEPGELQLGTQSTRNYGSIVAALALLAIAIGTQLIPVSEDLVRRLSPARNELQYERMLAIADRRDPMLVPEEEVGTPRPLSIAPSRTRIGLAGVISVGVLLIGTANGLSRIGVRSLVPALLILGVLVEFIGIYRVANGIHSVYGTYVPLLHDIGSAPFINRNHQAGWLTMVLSLALGALAGEVARGMRGIAPRWRDRLVWLSSKQANLAALFMFASAVLAIGILTTQSRSGAASMTVTFLVVTLWSLRRQPTKLRRRALAISLVAVALAVVSYAGEGVAKRLATTSWQGMDGRAAIWQDTRNIGSIFWRTGTGFNTYGVAMLRYQTVNDGNRYIEAHNDYLQLWAEGGVLVGIPALVLVVTLIITIYRRFRERADDTRTYWLRVGAVAGILAIAVQSVTEFTLQIPGAAAMFVFLLAIAIHHPRPRESRRTA